MKILKSKTDKKGMAEWELIGLIIAIAVLAFIFYLIINGHSESCKGIAQIFGSC